jgi:rubredoxin
MDDVRGQNFFAGSYGGNADKIGPTTKLECKICWHVYDPALGDEYWQIPAGTPFSALPDSWSCPNCDGKREEFLVLEDGA